MPARKRDSSYFGNELLWTTARCHRLIRPIASNINALRDLEELEITRSVSWQQNSAPKHHDLRIAQRQERTDARDLDWDTQAPRKKLKRTYGSRDRKISKWNPRTANGDGDLDSRRSQISEPGEITIQTPFLTRSFSEICTGSQTKYKVSKLARVTASSLYTMQDGARESLYVSQKRTLHGRLTTAFEKALEATSHMLGESESADSIISKASSVASSRRGPLSLLSLCLKNVPVYMKTEQSFRQEEDDNDDTDVAAELYAELEDLGSVPGQGWKHLRQVVRAHAVFLIRATIEEFCFNLVMVSELQRLCVTYGAITEAEDLMSSYIVGQVGLSTPYLSTRTNSVQTDSKTNETLQADKFQHSQTQSSRKQTSLCQTPFRNDGKAGVQHLRRRLQYQEPENHVRLLRRVFCQDANILGLSFQRIPDFLKTRKIPVEWLATSYSQAFWRAVLRSLSDGDAEHFNASEIIVVTLTIACNLSVGLSDDEEHVFPGSEPWHDRLDNTVLSLCAILTSIALLEQEIPEDRTFSEVSRRVMRPIREVSARVVRELDVQDPPCVELRKLRTRMIILATDMVLSSAGVQLLEDQPDNTFEERMEQLILLNEGVSNLCFHNTSGPETISTVICSVAQFYARAKQASGFNFLQGTVKRILSYHTRHIANANLHSPINSIMRNHTMAKPTTSTIHRASLLVKQTALSSAMTFASGSGTPQAYAFADEVEQAISGPVGSRSARLPILRTPAKPGGARSGYRWEQGISEWVSITPACVTHGAATPVFDNVSNPTLLPLHVTPTVRTISMDQHALKEISNIVADKPSTQPKFAVVIPVKKVMPSEDENKENTDMSPPSSKIPSPTLTYNHITKPSKLVCTQPNINLEKHGASTYQPYYDDSSEDELSMHEPWPSKALLGHQKTPPAQHPSPLKPIVSFHTRQRRRGTESCDPLLPRKRLTRSSSLRQSRC